MLALFAFTVPPKVSILNGQTINIHEGEDLTLFCQVQSNHGIIQLKWERVSNEKGFRADYSTDNSTLVIKNLNRQEAGQYRCTVTNKAGRKSDYVSVVVQCESSIK